MDIFLLKLNPQILQITSFKMPNNQLKVVVPAFIGLPGAGSRFIPDNSLSILKMHCLGLTIFVTNPGESSLQNNRIVLVKELETT